MEEIVQLCRPDIYAMKPYSSARTEGTQNVGTFLDANENPYPPFPNNEHTIGLNRYPQPQPQQLIDRFAEIYGASRERLFLSRGADEAIDLLVRAFCTAGIDGVMTTPPTFVMYETAARIQAARVFEVPLIQNESFELDTDGMLALHRVHPEIKLVFICSPNNPTSNLMNRDDILRLANELFGKALVVVDQLYVDYSGEPSLIPAIDEHPNLVVLRSVSKEYSLAGERCGITIAHPEVIGILHRIMAPYSLTVSAIRNIERAISIEGIECGKRNIQTILEERARVERALISSPAVERVFPSNANFLLVKTPSPGHLTKYMEDCGIKIRDRSNVIGGTVRISIGTPEENDQMLTVLSQYAQRNVS